MQLEWNEIDWNEEQSASSRYVKYVHVKCVNYGCAVSAFRISAAAAVHTAICRFAFPTSHLSSRISHCCHLETSARNMIRTPSLQTALGFHRDCSPLLCQSWGLLQLVGCNMAKWEKVAKVLLSSEKSIKCTLQRITLHIIQIQSIDLTVNWIGLD